VCRGCSTGVVCGGGWVSGGRRIAGSVPSVGQGAPRLIAAGVEQTLVHHDGVCLVGVAAVAISLL